MSTQSEPGAVPSSEVECSHLFPCTPDYRCSMHRTVRVWSGSRTSRPDAFDRALAAEGRGGTAPARDSIR